MWQTELLRQQELERCLLGLQQVHCERREEAGWGKWMHLTIRPDWSLLT